MKTFFPIVIISALCQVSAQTEPAHEWKVTLKVVDEASLPIAGAEAWVNYLTNHFSGLTDSNGIFTASHVDHSVQLAFQAHKSDYYSFWTQYHLGFRYNSEKWNPNITMVLRKIGQPIAMYAKKEETKMPKEDAPIGFDLMAGDWIAPYGKGKTADMIFTVHRKVVSVDKYDAELQLSFSNKGDGIAIASAMPGIGGDFKTSRTATETGYEASRVWHCSDSEQPESVFGYFIRVRTVLDENGNVKSALYGKINGDINLYVGTKAPRSGIDFTYCLNPTPNNLNLEFDPKQDLLGDLNSLEQVSAP